MRCIHIITTFLAARPSSLILFMHLYGRVEYETFSCRAQIHSNGKSIFSHAPKAIERLCVLFLAVAASPRLPDHFWPNNARPAKLFIQNTSTNPTTTSVDVFFVQRSRTCSSPYVERREKGSPLERTIENHTTIS